jgi:mRNA interferase MazF
MRRGDVITVAVQGDTGKPRPALVIQADHFPATLTVVVLPLTTSTLNLPLLRVTVEPSKATGLRERSQVMISRPQTLLREKAGTVIGQLDEAAMLTVGRLLAGFLGLG